MREVQKVVQKLGGKMTTVLKSGLKAAIWGYRRTLRFIFWLKIFLVWCPKTAVLLMRNNVVLVFASPSHSNLGDNAQTLLIGELLHAKFPAAHIMFFTDGFMYYTRYRLIPFIRFFLRKDARIFLHSGYHMTNLYPWEEWLNRAVIKAFMDRKIVALPQTINYTDKTEELKSMEIYNSHPDFTIMCRDEVSYEKCGHLFPKCKRLLIPDVVTAAIGKWNFNSVRDGVLLCLRNDAEALVPPEIIVDVRKELSSFGRVVMGDTTVADSNVVINKDLSGYLKRVWESYSKYKLIITDRYHGTIFSLIAGTPVLVISSTDHKLSSGVKWFPKEFNDYVKFEGDQSKIVETARIMLARKLDHRLPRYFADKYFGKTFLEGI